MKEIYDYVGVKRSTAYRYTKKFMDTGIVRKIEESILGKYEITYMDKLEKYDVKRIGQLAQYGKEKYNEEKKKNTLIYIDEDVLREPKELALNISKTCENCLKQAISKMKLFYSKNRNEDCPETTQNNSRSRGWI